MYSNPRFQRGGFRPNYNRNVNQRGRARGGHNQGQFYSDYNHYNPRPNNPNFGRPRGGNPGGGHLNRSIAGGFNRGRQHSNTSYGYEEAEEKGQFEMAESTSYGKTDIYSTGNESMGYESQSVYGNSHDNRFKSLLGDRPTSHQSTRHKPLLGENQRPYNQTTGSTNYNSSETDYNDYSEYSTTEYDHVDSEFNEGLEEPYEVQGETYMDQYGYTTQQDTQTEDVAETQYDNSTEDGYTDNSYNVQGQKEKTSEIDSNKPTSSTNSTSTRSDKPNEANAQTENKEEVEEVKQQEEEKEEEGDSDSSEEDTGFCKYCNMSFQSAKAYHTHTRGMQHTTLIMEAKAKKGNKHYQKEVVDEEVLKVVIPEPQPVKEESNEEDDAEFLESLNWMELDEETRNYIVNKRKIKPEDRDLCPDDIGRRQFSDKYTCPLCDCKCTGAASFKMHVEGKQHKNNLEQAQKGGPLKKKKPVTSGVVVDVTEKESKLSEQLKSIEQAVLGLEYITEFQKPEKSAMARYVCNLCEAKCDESTVVAHLVGLKHRLKYFQQNRPQIYDHLTKYTSKKKRSEMNYNADDFASQVESEVGRLEVKVKIELAESEDALEETMQRTSEALKETVADLEKKSKMQKEAPKPPPEKRPRYRPGLHYDQDYDYYQRRHPRDYHYGHPMDRYVDDYRRHPYDAEYRDRFAYRQTDPYYERMLYDERRRLDDMMERRYRLTDPILEQKRVDDIIARREYLERQEKSRLDDILERRRRLQVKSTPTDDVDYDRLKRFENRKPLTAASTSDRHAGDDRPSMEELLARRQVIDYGNRSRVQPDPGYGNRSREQPDPGYGNRSREQPDPGYRNRSREQPDPGYRNRSREQPDPGYGNRSREQPDPGYRNRSREQPDPGYRNRSRGQPDPGYRNRSREQPDPPAQTKVSEAKEQQERAVKALKEAAAQNPNINVAEVVGKLRSSLIASEDDAAMALEISNALTQALMQYRLQKAPEQFQSISQSSVTQMQSEPSIPGLDSSEMSAGSGGHVPSFLRTSAPQSVSETQYYPNTQTLQSGAQNLYDTHQQVLYSQHHQIQSSIPQTILQLKSPVSQLTYSQAAKLPTQVESAVAVKTNQQPVRNQEEVDLKAAQAIPPAKLLESIRHQTEMIKQRLASVTGGQIGTDKPSSSNNRSHHSGSGRN